MKKILLFLLILLTPTIVWAKTPTGEDLLKVIEDIENVQVEDNLKILNTKVGDKTIAFHMEQDGKLVDQELNYDLTEKEFSFGNGQVRLFPGSGEVGAIRENELSFYLYSILESLSEVPYDEANYYNNQTITKILKNDKEVFGLNTKTYKEPSNTFGFSIEVAEATADTRNAIIVYHYYLDGDFPIVLADEFGQDGFKNPSTGNYNMIITIMLLAVIAIAVYTYMDSTKKQNEL